MKYFICGFTGSGKTTLLNELKSSTVMKDYIFVDLDQYIAEQHTSYSSLGDYIRDVGFEQFRADELSAILSLKTNENLVLALGGGTLRNEVIENLNDFKGFWLNTPIEACLERINGDLNRPISQLPKEELLKLYNERLAFYSKFIEVCSLEDIKQHLDS